MPALSLLRGWRADGAALLLGMFAAAALPPVFALPVLLVCFPGLLILIEGAPTVMAAARRGWWFGFGLYLVGLYWVTEAILVEAARFWWLVPLAVPALAALLGFFTAPVTAVAWFARPGWRRALALVGAWVMADFARQFALGGFPWNPLGSVWEFPGGVGDVFIQPAAWVGVQGLTLATVLLACTPLLGRGVQLAGAVMLALWAGAGGLRLGPAPPPSEPLTAVLVQGNVAEGHKWERDYAIGILRHYLELTREGVAQAGPGPKVVIWPESASPFLIAQEPVVRQVIAEASGGNPSLVGSVSFAPNGQPLNTLFALRGDGEIAGSYDKWHLVPFGEYQPSWARVGVQVVPGAGFAAGPGPETLRVPGLPPFAPFICYEAIFAHQIVNEADRPDWMVNVTNDAWFGNSSGPRQHLAAARLRAVEEGLPLMRAANTGITAGFDAYGRELGRLEMNRSGVLDIRLTGRLSATLFSRFGLPIPFVLASLALAGGLLRAYRRH